jgi:hypothetical protein
MLAIQTNMSVDAKGGLIQKPPASPLEKSGRSVITADIHQAEKDVIGAEQDVAFICQLLRKKGLPIEPERDLPKLDALDDDDVRYSPSFDASDFVIEEDGEERDRFIERLEEYLAGYQ